MWREGWTRAHQATMDGRGDGAARRVMVVMSQERLGSSTDKQSAVTVGMEFGMG